MGKRCLRRLAARRLPASVVQAKKSGFAPPLAAWLRGPLLPRLRDQLGGDRAAVAEWVEPTEVQRMIDEHAAGRRNHARPLWLLLVLETWAKSRLGAGART